MLGHNHLAANFARVVVEHGDFNFLRLKFFVFGQIPDQKADGK